MADLWQHRAACAGADPDIFFSSKRMGEAAALCARCPVTAQCRSFSAVDRVGVWAGESRGDGKNAGPSLTKDYLEECGTATAYKRHLRRGEHCDRCLVADRFRKLDRERVSA